MQMRVTGTDAECRTVLGQLGAVVEVLEVDGPRARRDGSRLVWYYLEVRVTAGQRPADGRPVAGPTEPGPAQRR